MTLDPTAAYILGHAIHARGQTFTTWTIDLDDEPTEPLPPEQRATHPPAAEAATRTP